jgi:hypothetical protein
VQFDAIWLGEYTQMWNTRLTTDAAVNWDRHGYDGFTADRGARIWRQTYFGLGKNLEYCIKEGKKNGQWDVVGAAEVLKAYMFLLATNVHGEIIWREAFNEDSLFFRYDNQDVVYAGLDSLIRDAIGYLSRTDFNPNSQRLVRGDLVYGGNTANWRKFAYGLLARIYNAQINKPAYKADSVIRFCDLSFANNTEDFLIPHDASRNADANIFGTFRDNLNTNGGAALRQSDFIVRLLDGRVFAGSNIPANRDPRMRHMLGISADSSGTTNGGYRGSIPGQGDPNGAAANTRIRIPVLWGDSLNANPGAGNFANPPGKYLFHNKVVFPLMTYAEIQFMKAEAALRKGDPSTAFTAYQAGINGHFNFINRASYPRGNNVLFNQLPISATDRANYLAGANVKQSAGTLTLADIMQQKFIALWGWGFVENWVDQRKYHYRDIDPVTGQQVYSGLIMPDVIGGAGNLFLDNGGKYVQRVRYRYNSEYVWNIYRPAISDRADFHVIECWFSQP